MCNKMKLENHECNENRQIILELSQMMAGVCIVFVKNQLIYRNNFVFVIKIKEKGHNFNKIQNNNNNNLVELCLSSQAILSLIVALCNNLKINSKKLIKF